MDLHEIIRKLNIERQRLEEAIALLEQLRDSSEVETAVPKSRRGRKFMDEQARQEVSVRMKKYWAARRKTRQEQGGSE